LHFGVEFPLLGVPLPLVQVMNGPLVCGTVVPLKPPGTVVEVWHMLHATLLNGTCWPVVPTGPGGCSGWPPACPCAVPKNGPTPYPWQVAQAVGVPAVPTPESAWFILVVAAV